LAGAEAVQLYLGDLAASVERPARELKGFAKVFLQPGESRRVDLPLRRRDLSFWDVATGDWKAEPGEFEVMLGASSADIRLRERFGYEEP
ncbi:MAG: fibronectin type III-like domain-contianing protein, partial [Xanthomonadales bacterium]